MSAAASDCIAAKTEAGSVAQISIVRRCVDVIVWPSPVERHQTWCSSVRNGADRFVPLHSNTRSLATAQLQQKPAISHLVVHCPARFLSDAGFFCHDWHFIKHGFATGIARCAAYCAPSHQLNSIARPIKTKPNAPSLTADSSLFRLLPLLTFCCYCFSLLVVIVVSL